MAAVADALLPATDPLPGGAEIGTGAQAMRLLERMPRAVRRAIGAELILLERLSSLRGFSALPVERRERVLERLGRLRGPLGESVLPLKLLALLAYLGSPRVTAALGAEPGQLVPLAEPLAPAERLPVLAHPDVRPGTTEVADVVIVGSGAGGAPVARAMARAGWSVAVTEEGDAFTRDDFTGPEVDRMARLYRDGGATVTLGRPPVFLPVGMAVGGTTVVNSGTCLRTPAAVVASWRERFGVSDLSPEDLDPWYEEVERTLSVAPVPWDLMGNNGKVVHRGAEALGIPGRPLSRNAAGCHGSGVCAAGCPVDGKRGVHLNYLPQAVAAGARIFSRARVDHVLQRDGRAVGVSCTLLDEARRPVGRFGIHARRGVVVAGGALCTPGILRRSGVGGRGALGANLRIHPGTAVIGMFDEDIVGWRGVLQSYLVDALADRGVLLEATFPPPALSYGQADLGLPAVERARMLSRLRNMAIVGVLVSDTSRGRVWMAGRTRSPLVTYDLNATDAARALEGMALAARILFAGGATEVYPLLKGAVALRSPGEADAALSRPWARSALRLSAYHPMGTARMGTVVDSLGRVRDAERLAVIDASVFPSSLGVNPQVTIMAFAERAAAGILDRW